MKYVSTRKKYIEEVIAGSNESEAKRDNRD